MGSMQIHAVDIAIIIAYLIGMIALGVWIGREKIHGGTDFFLASREMKWPLIGASLFSTNISSQQFVGQAGLAFTVGLAVGMFQMIGGLCFILLGVFFMDVYMGLRLYTSPEFFERRYSRGARKFVSMINILGIVTANLAAALYAGATVMTELMGWEGPALFWTAVLVIGGVAGAYTLMGGLKSVILTDFVQAFILIAGGAVTLVVGVIKAGGLGAILDSTTADGFSRWSVVRPWDHAFGWLPLATGVMILGVHGHCTDHDYVQRCLAAKNLYHARMGCVFAAFLKVLALFIIAAPGIVAASLFPDLKNGDQAYARLLIDVMPVGLTGLCLAGLLAAIMSSVDSGLCATSSLLTYDFFTRRDRVPDEAFTLRLGRWLILILLIASILIAPQIRQFKALFNYLINIWALIAPPVFVCVIFGLFDKRANARGAVATLLFGSLLGAIDFLILNVPALTFLKEALPKYLQNAMNAGFVITLLCVAVMLAVSRLVGSTDADRQRAQAIRQSRQVEPLAPSERRRLRIAIAAFALVWLGVVVLFSPLGIGRTRPAASPAPEAAEVR